MNPIDELASKIADFIRQNHPKASSKELLTYSLIITINTLTALLVSFVICAVAGNLERWLVVFLILTVLRYFTGGAHLNSSLSCCIFTIIVFLLLVFVKYPYDYLGLTFDIISLFVFAIYAPKGIDVIRKVSLRKKWIIKICSLLFIFSNFYLQNSLLSSIIIVQAFSLTPWFEKIFKLERSY
ncbi:accessory gene regulator B family protein [Paenibacillus sp. OAS669]|uniref:accessory gene regulator B family protein n=1 Tax=Paenibacillus sp. OAS669 TaxID=2663821 RepID=UPI00178A1CC0|nr:accessory gene regulator B family protein [Paenibacillus sp. OAS669]MBE1442733.1 accessory gene regulator B [Paenibacillus sp. OAS669]